MLLWGRRLARASAGWSQPRYPIRRDWTPAFAGALTHLAGYAHGAAITFECGAVDTHMPPEGALRFKAALADAYRPCPEKLRVNLHPGVGHTTTPEMWHNYLEWFGSLH